MVNVLRSYYKKNTSVLRLGPRFQGKSRLYKDISVVQMYYRKTTGFTTKKLQKNYGCNTTTGVVSVYYNRSLDVVRPYYRGGAVNRKGEISPKGVNNENDGENAQRTGVFIRFGVNALDLTINDKYRQHYAGWVQNGRN